MGSTLPSNKGPTRPPVGAANLLPAALAPLLVGSALLLAGCGGGGGTDSTSSASPPGSAAASGGAHSVTIQDYTYKPADITVAKGTTVAFTNKDATSHTVTSKDSGVFDSGPIKPGLRGQVTFEKSGTFAYYCVFHPFMKGTITVE
jgi:plastocyanin